MVNATPAFMQTRKSLADNTLLDLRYRPFVLYLVCGRMMTGADAGMGVSM